MYKADFKIVLLGTTGTGKTSLLMRCTQGRFSERYQSTICLAYNVKVLEFNNRLYHIGIWDTAGCERFRSITRSYYRDASAAIICYDIFDRLSWNEAKTFIRELNLYEPDCKIYLCGTKSDLLHTQKRAIELNEAIEFASIENNYKFMEISNRTGENVDEIFLVILEDYVNDSKTLTSSLDSEKTLNLNASKRPNVKKCCF